MKIQYRPGVFTRYQAEICAMTQHERVVWNRAGRPVTWGDEFYRRVEERQKHLTENHTQADVRCRNAARFKPKVESLWSWARFKGFMLSARRRFLARKTRQAQR